MEHKIILSLHQNCYQEYNNLFFSSVKKLINEYKIMAKKNLNSSIQNLMSGLVSTPKEPQNLNPSTLEASISTDTVESPKKRGPKPRKEVTEQISTVVLKSDMEKLRVVCQLEGCAIKDIIGAGISSFLKRYEKKYGEIQVKKSNQGRINDIIDSF